MKITQQFLATLPAEAQTFLTGHGWRLHHSTLAALPQTLNTLLGAGHRLQHVLAVDDAHVVVGTTQQRKFTGIYAHLRRLFSHVGDEYTVAELKDLTQDFSWHKVTVALSRFRRMRQGIDVRRDTARGVYSRVR